MSSLILCSLIPESLLARRASGEVASMAIGHALFRVVMEDTDSRRSLTAVRTSWSSLVESRVTRLTLDKLVLPPSIKVFKKNKYKIYLYAEKLCGSLNETKIAAFSFGLTHAQAIDSGLSPDIP